MAQMQPAFALDAQPAEFLPEVRRQRAAGSAHPPGKRNPSMRFVFIRLDHYEEVCTGPVQQGSRSLAFSLISRCVPRVSFQTFQDVPNMSAPVA